MNNVVMGLLCICPVTDPDITRQDYTYKVMLRPFRRQSILNRTISLDDLRTID